jgi:cardiolipin synthase (CMP-forming)
MLFPPYRLYHIVGYYMKFDRSFFYTLQSCEKKITIPTMLTILRIVLVPFIILAMTKQQWGAAFCMFVIASASDFFDGILARHWNLKTVLGACLDPIADKVLLISCFATLAFIQSPVFAVPHWFVMLILCKELIILFGSLFLLVSGIGFTVKPTYLGKATTCVQILFISWLFFCYFFHWVPTKTYYGMIGVMVSFVLISFAQYVHIGLRYLVKMGKKS